MQEETQSQGKPQLMIAAMAHDFNVAESVLAEKAFTEE